MPAITAIVTTETQFELSIETAAQWFCELDDDHQAKFFVEVAKIMETWGPGKLEWQAHSIGSHLKNCECSTDEARQIVRELHGGLEYGVH